MAGGARGGGRRSVHGEGRRSTRGGLCQGGDCGGRSRPAPAPAAWRRPPGLPYPPVSATATSSAPQSRERPATAPAPAAWRRRQGRAPAGWWTSGSCGGRRRQTPARGAGRGRASGGGGAGVPGKKGVDATRKLGGGGQSPGVERMPAGGPSCAAPQHTGGAPCRRRRARSRAGTGGSPGHPCQPPAPVESTLRQTAARLVEVGGRAVGGQRVIEVVGGVVLAALTAMGCGQGDRVGRTALSEQARFRVAGVCPAVRAAQHRPARQGPPRPTPHLGGVAQRLVRLLHPLELVLGGLPPRLVRRALQCTRTRAAAVRGGGVGSGAAAAAVAINASGRCSALRLPPSPQLPSPPPPAPACRGGAAARSAGTPP